MKKTLITLFTTIFVSACGTDVLQVEGPKGEKGDTGAPGKVIKELPDFVGEYYLPYQGFAIININHENEYSTDVNLQFLNPNNTLCVLDLDGSTIDLHDGVIVYTGAVSMVAGNCQSSSGSALLTAAGVTYQYEVSIAFNSDNLIEVGLLIVQTSSGVKTIVIEKTLTEE